MFENPAICASRKKTQLVNDEKSRTSLINSIKLKIIKSIKEGGKEVVYHLDQLSACVLAAGQTELDFFSPAVI